jgi:hypothetical protein
LYHNLANGDRDAWKMVTKETKDGNDK